MINEKQLQEIISTQEINNTTKELLVPLCSICVFGKYTQYGNMFENSKKMYYCSKDETPSNFCDFTRNNNFE